MMRSADRTMRHYMSLLIASLMLAGTGLAQSQGSLVIPSVPAPRDPLPRFTIAPRGEVLAPIGLPLPAIGLPPADAPAPPPRRAFGQAIYSWPMVFYVPEPVYAPPAPAEPEPKPVAPPLPGRLVLDISPKTAQVFAGGYYVGTAEDFSLERGGGVLDAGIYRLDVSAAGYEPVAVDLRIASGQSVTYRATMKAIPTQLAAEPTT